jgi:hypothetical protein
MDAVVNFISSWPVLIHRAFTEHSLAVAVVTVAAIGIFVVLQHELRPYGLVTNIMYVVGGWLAAMSVLVYVMAGLRKGWSMFEQALPFVAKLSAYLYGICERHPILALVIVGVGTTACFLKHPWPTLVSWAPLRVVCAIFGVALAIHIAGPIADLVLDEPAAAQKTAAKAADKFAAVPPEAAVAQAIKAGDLRYVSVRQCLDEVSGYPVAETGKAEVRSPRTVGVKPLGASCYESLGHDGSVRMNRDHAYAAEFNRLMYKHNQAVVLEQLTAR